MSRRTFLRNVGAGAGLAGIAKIGEAIWTGEESYGSRPPTGEGGGEKGGQEATVPQADYYVTPDGHNDSAGTESDPFGSVEAAVEAAEPGDTIFLRGGFYDRSDRVAIADFEGTADEKIVIAGAPDERPIFDFDGPTPGGWDYDSGLLFQDVKHLIVKNISVRNSKELGIELSGDSAHNVFENISVTRNNLVGFGVYEEATDNELRSVVSAYNFDRQNSGMDADGIQLSTSGTNTIRDSKAYHNSDDGFDLWETRGVKLVGCTSWANGRGEKGDGNGFKLGGGERPSGGHFVARCAAFDNRWNGFTNNSAERPIEVYHTTALNNRINYSFHDGEHVLKNNISHRGRQELESNVVQAHNTWNLGIETPHFESLYPGTDQFLHLSRTSPCIDAGVPIEALEYGGKAPDLGMYPYDSGRSETTERNGTRRTQKT